MEQNREVLEEIANTIEQVAQRYGWKTIFNTGNDIEIFQRVDDGYIKCLFVIKPNEIYSTFITISTRYYLLYVSSFAVTLCANDLRVEYHMRETQTYINIQFTNLEELKTELAWWLSDVDRICEEIFEKAGEQLISAITTYLGVSQI